MKINVPPLKIWIWVVVSFFLFQLFVIGYYDKHKKSSEGDSWFSSQLQDIKSDFINKTKTTYNVIIIGSSLVGNGVECPDEIAGTLAEYKTSNILLEKIWQPHDQLQYFISNKNLINELLVIKPDLVCIQTELAAIRYEETEKFFYTDFEDYLQNIATENSTIFKDLFSNQQLKPVRCADNFIDYEVLTDTLNYIPAKRYCKKKEEIQFAFEGLKKLTDAGIKIVLVDIPRPQQVEKIMYTQTFSEQLNSLFDMYRQKFGIEHWRYTTRPMYFKDFHDGGHLNKGGRHLFTKDLLEKIINETGNKK
jgi:hypothetical protein